MWIFFLNSSSFRSLSRLDACEGFFFACANWEHIFFYTCYGYCATQNTARCVFFFFFASSLLPSIQWHRIFLDPLEFLLTVVDDLFSQSKEKNANRVRGKTICSNRRSREWEGRAKIGIGSPKSWHVQVGEVILLSALVFSVVLLLASRIHVVIAVVFGNNITSLLSEVCFLTNGHWSATVCLSVCVNAYALGWWWVWLYRRLSPSSDYSFFC